MGKSKLKILLMYFSGAGNHTTFLVELENNLHLFEKYTSANYFKIEREKSYDYIPFNSIHEKNSRKVVGLRFNTIHNKVTEQVLVCR